MADLISKQEVCEVLAHFAPENYTQLVEMLVVKLPAVDAVEVVRCKDCMHWREESLWCDMNSKDRGEHYNWYAEDFCSYGERREENAAD